MRLLPYGDTGLLVEVPGAATGDVLALDRALRAAAADRPAGVLDLVPAATTLLVTFDAGTDPASVARWVEGAASRAVAGGLTTGPAADPVTLEVVYDGEDLQDVGRLTGLGADGVVAAHTGSVWTVAFTGFAPGFGYLDGGDPRLEVPRLDVPRTRVPAGAVGLAGPYSGVYPRASPGGWRLLGRTATPVWDADREPPALLRPGVRVRFVAVDVS